MSKKRTFSELLQENYKVHMIRTLVHMPKRDEAGKILQKLVNQTRLLMQRQHWKVTLLCEFYPKDKRLLGLNVNSGSRVMIRLRSPSDSSHFLPYESLLGTMIHELVHIKIHPHNSFFYQMVDDLSMEVQKDIYSLQYREWTSEMEFGKGYRLGGESVLSARKKDSKELVRQATLKRHAVSVERGNSSSSGNNNSNDSSGAEQGRKLGGNIEEQSKLTPRELRLQAIEKRFLTEQFTPIIVIPEKQIYTKDTEQSCHDQMSNEELDLLMQSTQDVPIIEILSDDDEGDEEGNDEDIGTKNPVGNKNLTKDNEAEFCQPCTKTKRKIEITNEKVVADVLIKEKRQGKYEIINLIDEDDDLNNNTSDESAFSVIATEESWECNVCLEKNFTIHRQCQWCGKEHVNRRIARQSLTSDVLLVDEL